MVKVEVIEEFTLGRFNELKNIQRKAKEEKGKLFTGDIFECTEELADYLIKSNPLGRAFVRVIEVIPEKEELKDKANKIVKQAKEKNVIKPVEELFKEEEKTKTKSKKTIAKK